MAEITMPRLSESMLEGTILTWLKRDGEKVRTGEELVEIETDKAAMTHAAEAEGVLTIVAPEGASLPVGALLGHLLASAEPRTAPVPTPLVADRDDGQGGSRETPLPSTPPVLRSRRATPMARRIAQERGIDLATVSGSGPAGRIVIRDLVAPDNEAADRAAAMPLGVAGRPAERTAAPGGRGEVHRDSPTRVQRLVAQNTTAAHTTQPDFAIQAEIDMSAIAAIRSTLRAQATDGERIPSYNDFAIAAAARALRRHPNVNSSFRDGLHERYSRINIGMAVATPGSLLVVTIFDADTRSLGTIARSTQALARRARDGSITPPELADSTFTISNLGMHRTRAIYPILNGGQAAILGLGAIEDRVVPRDGEPVIRATLTGTLVCDHRVLNGADAAAFLADVADTLERPLRVLID